MKLVLASGSPRRRELLANLGLDFEIVVAEVEESSDESLGLEGLALYNAQLKAQRVFEQYETPIVVLGADTVVWHAEKAFGKPKDMNDALRMLTILSGQTHRVGTGVSLLSRDSCGQVAQEHFCEITEVTFHPLNRSEIETYLAQTEVMDKAGAYAIQDGGERIVGRYDGSFTNVMGLPAEQTQERLLQLGVRPA